MIQVDNNEPLISRSAAARLRTNAVRPKLRLFCPRRLDATRGASTRGRTASSRTT